MRTKLLFWTMIVCSIFTLNAQNSPVNDKYQPYWTKIEKAQKEGLPKSALKESRAVLAQAKSDKNGPAILKSLVLIAGLQQTIAPDSVKYLFREMEGMLEENQEPAFKSLLHSALAELYHQSYRREWWAIRQRTAIASDNSDDMSSWTSARYIDVIVSHIKQSLQNQSALSTVPTEKYALVLDKGKDSPRLRPSMYDLLVYRAVELLQENDFEEYRSIAISALNDLKNINTQKGNGDAYLMAELQRLSFCKGREVSDNQYEQVLLALQKKYRNSPISVEVDLALAEFYLENDNDIIPLNEDNSEVEPDNSTKIRNYEKILQICNEAIRLYPNYDRIGQIQSLKEQILLPFAHFSMPSQLYPGQKVKIKIHYRNLDQFSFRIYRVDAPMTAEIIQTKTKYPEKLVLEQKLSLPNPRPYLEKDTVVEISVYQIGNYRLESSAVSGKEVKNNGSEHFSVSKIASVSRSAAGAVEVLAADFRNGDPLTNATVILYKQKYPNQFTEVSRGKTQAHGLFTVDNPKEANAYQVVDGDDVYSPISYLPYSGNQLTTLTGADYERLFTDRAVYRPGQIVYFKGYAYRSSLERGTEATEGKSVIVTLKDANGREIDKKELVSNEFGSFAGSFILPKQTLNGEFSISTANANYSFSVAEYKLPKFKIELKQSDKTYQFGDNITVRGNAQTFSGVKMDGQVVKYKVTRRMNWFCRWGSRIEKIIATGTAKTDANGQFTISFPVEKDPNSSAYPWLAYNFNVEASLTDKTGETQQADLSVPVGNVSMALDFEMPQDVDREHLPKIIIRANNLSGMSVTAKGSYRLYRYENQTLQEIDDNQKLVREKKPRLEAEFEANKPINTDRWNALTSGEYLIVAETKDEQGRIIKEERRFTLFHFYEKEMPKTAYVWLYKSVTECRVGEGAVMLFGSSADADVLFEVYDNKSLVDRKRLKLDNNVRIVVVQYLSSYGKSITVQFSYFKNGHFFHESVDVKQAEPDRKISMRWSSFRDKTTPGQKEEWKLTVRDREDYPLKAEVQAEMYDLSLDQIRPFNPVFNLPTFATHALRPWYSEGQGFSNETGWLNFDGKQYKSREFDFDQLKLDINSYRKRSLRAGIMESKAAVGAVNFDKGTDEVEPFTILNETRVVTTGIQPISTKKITLAQNQTPITIRKNFGETAFFYPQLKTNKDGDAVVSFTVPDNLSDWKFIGRAHTKDMRTYQLLDTISVRKDLMIESYMPRFVRQGDKVVLTAKISNLSDKSISGNAKVEIFNPFTGKILTNISLSPQPYELPTDGNTSVAWNLDIPSDAELLGCRFIAESGQFSDGEEQILPVLTKRQLVTEALPLNLGWTGDKKISLPQGSPSQTDYRITLELVSNPAWYAVHALPVVAEPTSEDLVSWVTALYANSLATHIVASNPGIQNYFKTASLSTNAQEAFRSKLEKNEELKSVLIQETPWVNQAVGETQHKQRLSELLNSNRSKTLTDKALTRITQLQNNDGSFSWYPQMSGSAYLTRFVLSSLSHLLSLGATENNPAIKPILEKAVHYLDADLLKTYEDLKKYNSNWSQTAVLSLSDLQTLVLRAAFPNIEMSAKEKEAYQFYQTLAEQHWVEKSLQEKALTLILMKRLQNQSVATNILKSIKEFGSESPEFGYYFPSLTPDHRWGRTAITVHTQIMDAFELMGTEAPILKKMQIWLLKQKQTEQWNSLPETVDAVYALLKRDSELLAATGKVSVKFGDNVVLKTNDDSPTFEYKAEIPVSDFNKSNREIVFTKTSPGITWGAIYRQYFEDMDKIKAQKGALSVSKTLYREALTGNQKQLQPVTPGMPLRVGDKVI
ncbi:MAG: alpha-2-macroglobulin family protein, partial [Bacteroidota bacterium]|nr:alpha-2-macroglobulin family protein [Bacteroidota bacterium]